METPVLLLVVYDPNRRAPASEGDFLGIMSLGCMMQNMWLMAESLGLGFHVVSSLSNYEVEKELKKMLNIPAHLMIAISFRLGYPVKPFKYLRVRRDVEDFAHYNGY
jgi:nitroreductase